MTTADAKMNAPAMTGELLWTTQLEAGATAAPMTYLHRGKQYVVFAIGSQQHAAEFVASLCHEWALPELTTTAPVRHDAAKRRRLAANRCRSITRVA